MNLGKALKTCRLGKGLTQEELALKAHISKSYLSQIESNKRTPDLQILKKIADALKIPLNIIIFMASDKEEITEFNEELIEKLSTLFLKLIKND